MTTHETNFVPYPVPDGIVDVQGNPFMSDGTGGYRAVESIAPMKLLQDQMVRREFGWAFAIAAQLRRFREHLMDNLDTFDAMTFEKFGVKVGGKKGNRTYSTFDGLMQIEVRLQDRVAYGPELMAAKALFDECLNEWAAETRAEMRSIVTNAFNTDQAGQINRNNVHTLLQTQSEDERWLRAQDAIRAAIYVVGAKEYVLFKFRKDHREELVTLKINLANA
jgi:hypothetical protein